MNKKEISQKFNNINNIYYGHGIGADNKAIIASIFKNGLRCSHKQLNFTTIALGEGSNELFEEIQEILDNWQHKNSKQIIIASIPRDYHLICPMGTTLYGKEQAAFYNYFSQDEAGKIGIAQGFYLKPEFVSGVYDANSKTFISNKKYYENLSIEEQQKIFTEVKKQYIKLLKQGPWTLKEYAEILQSAGIKIPLTPEEIYKADKEILDVQEINKDDELER